MNIRSYEPMDREEVVNLWENSGLTRSWNDPNLDIERTCALDQRLFIVGVEDNSICAVAMGGYDGHRGSVNYLAVQKEFRLQGLAKEMMREIEARLIELGCPKINLMVRHGNDGVIQFYKQIGYDQDPVVVLSKRLINDD